MGMMMAVILLPPTVGSTLVSNVQPRLDTDGGIVDAHGGGLYFFCADATMRPPCVGKFWLIGTAYNTGQPCPGTDAPTNGSCTPTLNVKIPMTQCNGTFAHCGFRNQDYRAYSAATLAGPWKLESSSLLPPRGQRAPGIYWRPKLLWNQKHRRYILWYERGAGHGAPVHGAYGVAVASSPAGPFKIVNPDVHLKWSYLTAGDSSLMQLPNGTAYIIYKSNMTSVELLSDDYLSSTYQNSGDIAPRAATEAPALFFVSIGYILHVFPLCLDQALTAPCVRRIRRVVTTWPPQAHSAASARLEAGCSFTAASIR